MRHLPTIAVIIGLALPAGSLRAKPVETPAAYEIVAGAMVSILPSPPGEFFTLYVDGVRAAAVAGLGDPANSPFPGDAGWHYIMLDVAVAQDDAASKRAAARAFPHDRSAALTLFEQHGVLDGGSLPWVIGERYRAMVEAFRGGRPEEIVREAGVLLHLATDAAMPFHTTAERDGSPGANPQPPTVAEMSASDGVCRTARHRFEVGLVNRLRNRLVYEVRVVRERYRPASDPVEEAFCVLLEAHETLDAILAMDARTIADLDASRANHATDATGSAPACDAYLKRLADPAAPIIETCLESAACFAAGLIGAAWIEAGRPALSEPPSEARSRDESRPVSSDAAAPLVGSKHSTVVHRSDCPHAKRIKSGNRVEFQTPESAKRAGRTPCTACKPFAR